MGVLPEHTGLNYSGGYGPRPQLIAQLFTLSRQSLSREYTLLARADYHAHFPSLQSLSPLLSTLGSTEIPRRSTVSTR